MDIKTVCIFFLVFAAIEANTANVNTASTSPDLTPVDATGSVAYLRSKRQFGGYPGAFGGSNSFASANAVSGAGGYGLGGFGNTFSSATAAAGAGGGYLGKKK